MNHIRTTYPWLFKPIWWIETVLLTIFAYEIAACLWFDGHPWHDFLVLWIAYAGATIALNGYHTRG